MNFYLVDAFANEPFLGNPAAVFLVDPPLADSQMQNIAMEMNQSETAFLMPMDGKKFSHAPLFSLRWFSPSKEVDLCGHATLASAKVIFSLQSKRHHQLSFETKSGTLTVCSEGDFLHMNFPIIEPRKLFEAPQLKKALGVDQILNLMIAEKLGYLLVHLPSEEDVLQLHPDYEQLMSLDLDYDIKGLIVTAKGSHPYHFVSRFFTPWLGVNEDPVTGSSHSVLFPYWQTITGHKEMRARQLSARGGEMHLKKVDEHRLEIIGQAVIVAKGKLGLDF